MARKKTTAVATTIKPAPKFGAKARKLKRDFLKKRQAERESMALMIVEASKPVRKTTRRKTTKRKTSTSGVSPVCSRAGRRLKLVRSSSAGRTLSSPKCKTGAKKTTKRATTTAKKRTSSVKSIISPVTKKATTRKTTTTKKVTAKRTARRSVAASKLARIKKIVC